MKLHVAGTDQGQVVEIAYGWSDGALYRRIRDRSDGTETWAVAEEDAAGAVPETWCGDVQPPVSDDDWAPCDAPAED